MRATKFLIFLTALSLLVGCARRGGPGGIDPDAAFGGLDVDGDGKLTDDDLSEGRTAVFWRLSLDGEDSEEATSSTAGRIQQGDGNWFVVVDVEGELPMELNIAFQSPQVDGWDLVVGEGELQGAWGDPEGYFMGHEECPGDMVITAVDGGTASGWMDGTVEVTIYDDSESEVGSLFLDALSFKDIPVETWE